MILFSILILNCFPLQFFHAQNLCRDCLAFFSLSFQKHKGEITIDVQDKNFEPYKNYIPPNKLKIENVEFFFNYDNKTMEH